VCVSSLSVLYVLVRVSRVVVVVVVVVGHVWTNIGSLGEDATTDTREQSDKGSSETKPRQGNRIFEDQEQHSLAEHDEGHHRHAHDSPCWGSCVMCWFCRVVVETMPKQANKQEKYDV